MEFQKATGEKPFPCVFRDFKPFKRHHASNHQSEKAAGFQECSEGQARYKSAAWPNGKALDYDCNNWNQEIAGSIPAVVTPKSGFLLLLPSFVSVL
jgi:hypothetical protein